MRAPAVRVRRESWAAISAPLALLVFAGFATACRRERLSPPEPMTPAAAKSLPPPDAQRPADARPSPDLRPAIDPTFLVLIWMETTPPGAAVRRLSDGHVMGWTPETIEFNQSTTPVQVRFELDGYLPVTREVPVRTDGEVKVVLKPIPRKNTGKKVKGSKAQK